MRPRSRPLSARFLSLCLLSMLPGCSNTPGEPPKPPSYDSPQAVLDTARRAEASGDYKTYCNCLTPETHESMAAILAVSAFSLTVLDGAMGTVSGISALLGDDEAAEDRRAIAKLKAAKPKIMAVLEKHGVNLAEPPGGNRAGAAGSDAAAWRAVAEPIQNKAAFVEEMLLTFDAAGLMDSDESEPTLSGELVDLQITGDEAAGALLNKVAGEEFRMPIEFRKVGDRWLIDLKMGW